MKSSLWACPYLAGQLPAPDRAPCSPPGGKSAPQGAGRSVDGKHPQPDNTTCRTPPGAQKCPARRFIALLVSVCGSKRNAPQGRTGRLSTPSPPPYALKREQRQWSLLFLSIKKETSWQQGASISQLPPAGATGLERRAQNAGIEWAIYPAPFWFDLTLTFEREGVCVYLERTASTTGAGNRRKIRIIKRGI